MRLGSLVKRFQRVRKLHAGVKGSVPALRGSAARTDAPQTDRPCRRGPYGRWPHRVLHETARKSRSEYFLYWKKTGCGAVVTKVY